jgi:pimeloyl-ACP methyl ester carboxylesterase
LLRGAGEAAPYVLVGASAGGLYVRLYQADYPDDVAGLVLVDPASEDRLFTFFQGAPVAIASLTADQLRSTIPQRPASVPRRSPQTGAPFDRLPPDLYSVRIKLDERLIASVPETVPYDVVLASAEAERARLARLKQLRAGAEHPLGNLPVVVLSRGVDSSPELVQVHEALARLSSNSRHTVIDAAGHEIHLFKPDAVIQAIADVVESSRTKRPLPRR